MKDNIIVEGIETNNLKNIDVEIVTGGINLILGPSGSGKTTLAYETIAQIGQHEYMCMFADDVQEPTYKVRSFKNMLPAVPIKQTNHNNNTRSTIGTYFGISSKLSMIYAAILNLDSDYFLLSKEENVCECCHGLGTVSSVDIYKILNYNSTIRDIPFRCWNKYKDFYSEILCNFCKEKGIDPDKRYKDLSAKQQHELLFGESEKKYSIKYKRVGRIASRTTKYYGVMLNRELMPGISISKNYYSDMVCPICQGMKYNKEHLRHKIAGLSIGEFLTTDFSTLQSIMGKLKKNTDLPQAQFSLNKIDAFISKAVELKLGHLFLNRSIPTLSGGELQRLRLVQVFNTQLSNLLIVLDEPLAGLSPAEKKIIKQNIYELSKANTVLIVDHGKDFLQYAKKTICLGPEGGSNGGYIIDHDEYLNQQKRAVRFVAPAISETISLISHNAVYHYQGCKIQIALDCMNLVSGPSGVGKSTLLREYLPQLLEGYSYVNQKPLLGNTNSSVATVIDIASKIATVYGTKFKKDKKYFSNLTGNAGCCPKCGGSGYIEFGNKIGPSFEVECRMCHGTGFNPELEKYQIKQKNIFDIWNMTINEAIDFFSAVDKKIYRSLIEAQSIKLGHLKIGQPTKTLSGGENIRIKLLKSIHSTARFLGIDEPFKGLDPTERNAVGLFLESLRENGKTLIVIDHTEGIDSFFSKHIIISQEKNVIIGLDE